MLLWGLSEGTGGRVPWPSRTRGKRGKTNFKSNCSEFSLDGSWGRVECEGLQGSLMKRKVISGKKLSEVATEKQGLGSVC